MRISLIQQTPVTYPYRKYVYDEYTNFAHRWREKVNCCQREGGDKFHTLTPSGSQIFSHISSLTYHLLFIYQSYAGKWNREEGRFTWRFNPGKTISTLQVSSTRLWKARAIQEGNQEICGYIAELQNFIHLSPDTDKVLLNAPQNASCQASLSSRICEVPKIWPSSFFPAAPGQGYGLKILVVVAALAHHFAL